MKHRDYVEEEISLAELSERFLMNSDFTLPEVFDMQDLEIEVLTQDADGNEIYKPILNFVVKDEVQEYYTDGYLKGTGNHRIIENGEEIHLKDHPEFKLVNEPMKVVDIEVADEHSYLANGRLNHNTTSGGKAVAYHASVRLRVKPIGQLKVKVGGKDMTVGIKTQAQVIKNRMGPPLRSAEFSILFDSGIDDNGSWLEVMKNAEMLQQGGAWYTWVDKETGEEIKFLAKDFEDKILSDPQKKQRIYEAICDHLILKYRSEDLELIESDEVIQD